jgi:hypothetical protein
LNTTLDVTAANLDAFSKNDLVELLESQKLTSARLYSALRKRLVKEGSVHMNPPPASYTRRVQQLEKAYELNRQAQAKIELLILHFGGVL